MGDHVQDVMDLLGGFEKAAQAMKTIGTAKVSMIRPRMDLIDPWEKDFVDGYEMKNLDGSYTTLDQIKDAYLSKENIHLVGPSGAGKTTIARHIMDELNAPTRAENAKVWAENAKILEADPQAPVGALEKYNPLPYPMSHYSCHQGTRSEELIGNVTIKIDESGNRTPIEVSGAVTDAWEHGKTLIIEEFDLAPPGVLGELHLFLDGSSSETVVYINGPRQIFKHDEFRCIGTSNTRGAGEAAMEFAGTQPLNAAFMNRFNYTIQVGWLKEQAEAKLIQAKTKLFGSNVEKMIHVANKMRDGYENGLVERPISTRALLAWAREIQRAAKRIGVPALKAMTDADKWKRLGIPAAGPTIINGMADQTSRDAVTEALRLL